MMTLLKQQLRSASPRTYARLREAWNPWARLTGKVGRRQDTAGQKEAYPDPLGYGMQKDFERAYRNLS